MPSKRAMELAAQAWCTKTTERIVMDPTLAVVFAEALDAEGEAGVRFGFGLRAEGDVADIEDAVDAWYVREL